MRLHWAKQPSSMGPIAVEVIMPVCKECKEEVEAEDMRSVKVDGKRKKICGDCADRLDEEGAIAEESEAVVQQMMGFKGRR